MSGRLLRWAMSLAHRAEPANGNGQHESRLIIIRHHRVYADAERPLYRLGVSESVFAAQLELLRARGWTPITASEGWRHLAEGRPGRWVAMTFDDGYEDNVTRALPLLQRAGARGTFYLTAGLMEERIPQWWDVLAHALERTPEPRLSWSAGADSFDLPLESRAQKARALSALLPALSVVPGERERRLEDLRARLRVNERATCELATWDVAERLVEAGMEVGAHTLRHPLLATLPAEAQRDEIRGSIDLIRRRLSVNATGLAYPGGSYDESTTAAAAACGLEYAVTTRTGDNGAGAARFELKRRGLSEGTCLGPSGRFSNRLAIAELDGAFDRMRGVEAAS